MQRLTIWTAAALAAGRALANPAPRPATTPAPRLQDAVLAGRAENSACTFSGSDGYSSASASKTACSTIVLSALTVPAGETLDMEGLNDGTTVSVTLMQGARVCAHSY